MRPISEVGVFFILFCSVSIIEEEMSADAIVEQILRKLLLTSDRAGKRLRFLRRYLLACVRALPGSSSRKVIFYDERRNIYFSLFAEEKSFELIARKVAERVL